MSEPLQIDIDLTEDLTFEKGLGWRNTDGRITNFGYSHWLTSGGWVVMVPDQWEDKSDVFQPLPQSIINLGRCKRIGIPDVLPGAETGIGIKESKIILPGDE